MRVGPLGPLQRDLPASRSIGRKLSGGATGAFETSALHVNQGEVCDRTVSCDFAEDAWNRRVL